MKGAMEGRNAGDCLLLGKDQIMQERKKGGGGKESMKANIVHRYLSIT